MHMKPNKLLYLTLLLTLFTCCKRSFTEIPVLDVTKTYPSKNIILQDIADIVYFALETKDGFLISYPPIQYIDEEILVTNNREEIMVFDSKTGKALNSFNRFGRGPGEYTGIHSIAVDREKNEMFTTTNTLSSNIQPINVYDLHGKHLRTIGFPNIGFPQFFHSYNKEHLFWYNSNIEESSPYKLISKTDTTFTYLPITFIGRDKMSVSQTENSGAITTYSRNGGAILKTSDGYIFSETGIDTIYHWNNRNEVLTPVMIRTPSFKSMKIPIGVFISGQSSEYIFLNTIERKFDFETREGFKTVKLIYDKKSGQFYEGTIINSDFVDEKEVNILSPISVGQFVVSLQALELVELYKNGKLRGKLEEIASELAVDDNPVLMVVTFR